VEWSGAGDGPIARPPASMLPRRVARPTALGVTRVVEIPSVFPPRRVVEPFPADAEVAGRELPEGQEHWPRWIPRPPPPTGAAGSRPQVRSSDPKRTSFGRPTSSATPSRSVGTNPKGCAGRLRRGARGRQSTGRPRAVVPRRPPRDRVAFGRTCSAVGVRAGVGRARAAIPLICLFHLLRSDFFSSPVTSRRSRVSTGEQSRCIPSPGSTPVLRSGFVLTGSGFPGPQRSWRRRDVARQQHGTTLR